MSLDRSHQPVASNLNQSIQGSSSISRFEDRQEVISHDEMKRAPERLQLFLRDGMYDLFHRMRLPAFKRHDVLLRRIVLNDHSTNHVDEVTYIALQIARAFPEKFSAIELEAMVVGGMSHDVAFMEAAREWCDNFLTSVDVTIHRDTYDQVRSLLIGLDLLETDELEAAKQYLDSVQLPPHSVLGKKELDLHTVHGESVVRRWLQETSVQQAISHWDATHREIVAMTVLHHSNGSRYVPESVPDVAKVIRLADKLHNTADRSAHLLDARTLHDPRNIHQFVPASIQEMSLEMSHSAQNITVVYKVNPSFVEKQMRKFDSTFTYDIERFINDFSSAYGGKSVRLAAEVVQMLFAKAGDPYSNTATLSMRCEFPDGSSTTTTFEPLVSSK